MKNMSNLFKKDPERKKAKTEVEQLILRLRHEYNSAREEIMEALINIGVPAVEFLIPALEDEFGGIRAGAAYALGRIGDTRAVEPLIQLLNDENDGVRSIAATALGRLEDARAVPPLIQALKDKERGVRLSAAGALGTIRDVKAIPSLNRALEDEDEDVRRIAAQALQNIEEDIRPGILQTIITFINAENWSESKRIIVQHPELLAPETDLSMQRLVIMQNDEQIKRVVKEHQALLARCRLEGIEAAFAEKQGQAISLDLQTILHKLSQPVSPNEIPHRIELCQQALGMVRKGTELWADLQLELGDSLTKIPSGSRADNLGQAIVHYQQVIQGDTRHIMPAKWAEAMNNLSVACVARAPFLEGDEQAEELEQAIEACRQSLEVRTRQDKPVEWSATMYNLGNAYYARIKGDKADNIERAIEAYQQSLEITTRQSMPVEWSETMNNLGNAYSKRIRGERGDNLKQAIEIYQQALQVRTRQPGALDWATTMHNLAEAYKVYPLGDRKKNLEQAIYYYTQALQVKTRQDMPSEWAKIMLNLALIYMERTQSLAGNDRKKSLKQVVDSWQQALQVMSRKDMTSEGVATVLLFLMEEVDSLFQPSDIPLLIELCQVALMLIDRNEEAEVLAWARFKTRLAGSLVINPSGNRAENIEQAIQHHQQILEVYTLEVSPEEWARTHNNLGEAYRDRIRGEKADNLEQAIKHYQQALQVYTRETFPTGWALAQLNLARTYSARIRGENADNIEQMITHCEQALKVYTREGFPDDWARTHNLLGIAYHTRIRGQRSDNIEQAIDHCQQALNAFTLKAPLNDRSMPHVNLANLYRQRIRGERAENLEQAIEHCKQALRLCTHETFPEEWAVDQYTLGVAYLKRIRGDRGENLEQAIKHFQFSLKVKTREAYPIEWAHTQNTLGIAYSKRIRGIKAENLEQALIYYQQALTVFTKKSFPSEWATVQQNLGGTYTDRILDDKMGNLQQAIEHTQKALQVFTRQSMPFEWAKAITNLATFYQRLAQFQIDTERMTSIKCAITHYQQALELYTLNQFPADYQQTQYDLGNVNFMENNWSMAYQAYSCAINAGQNLIEAAYTEAGRQSEVRRSPELYANAAYCLFKMGKPDEALIRLEQGKTRLLAEALALGSADLAMLPEMQQQNMRDMRRKVRELEAEMRLPPDTPARRNDRELAEFLRQKRSELRHTIEAIREHHPDFMPTGLELPDILALIPEGGVLVAPVVTSQGSAVFVLLHGVKTVGTEHVFPLDSLTDDRLNSLLFGTKDNPGWLNAYINWHKKCDVAQWHVAMETFTAQLWEVLMKDIHQHLQEELQLNKGAPVLLMPQGGLGLLPLHAAWREVDGKKRYFLDDYQVTYVPSAYALNVSQQRLQEQHRHQRSFFAVVNPTKDLIYTPAEGEALKNLFDSEHIRYLSEDEATVDAVMQAVSGQSYIHFSCHGFYHWQEVMRSGLILAEGNHLTLSDIIAKLDLSAARLVTLSACETGMTEFLQTPDEYIGLPAGFLQAGALCIISTLWAVSDFTTTLLMERFYQNHLQQEMGISEALRQAQLWLRDLTYTEVLECLEQEHFKQHVPREIIRSYKLRCANQPDGKPFEHPYYWGAFTCNGSWK